MNIRNSVIRSFKAQFGKDPDYVVKAPGRVNLLGEHVDYNDGLVLPIAIDRATWLAFSPSGSAENHLIAKDLRQSCKFTSRSVKTKLTSDGKPLPSWAFYPAGVCWAAEERGLECPAINGVYSSNIPRGSGLSSSASVEMVFVLSWQTLANWGLSPMERALLGQKAENQYVGVQSGIMDQFASACGEENAILVLDCRNLDWRTIPIPSNYAYIVADTMKSRRLSSGEYNKRRADCEEAVRLLSAHLPGLKSLRDVTPDTFSKLAGTLPERIEKRSRHVVEEIERTFEAITLLESGDLPAFGKLLNQGHISLRDLYEVSIPELDIMVRLAQNIPGCLGARLTGAGFGGCTINIVEEELASDFVSVLAESYHTATGINPDIYLCHAAKGASLD
ncbi:MAG: galactokinase [Anaerolineaceae bacterium]|jgi:galactokinase